LGFENKNKMSLYKKKYDILIIPPGGFDGLYTLGCLQFLIDHEEIQLDQINKFVGVSVGGIISYFLCLGLTPEDMIITICENFENIRKTYNGSMYYKIIKLLKTKYVYNFDIFENMIRHQTMKKINTDRITLKQMYDKYNKHLILITFNYTLGKSEYLDYTTYPNLDCISAIKMSCSIPFLFEECMFNGNIYMDGAIIDSLPLEYIFNRFDKNTIIALYISRLENNQNKKIIYTDTFSLPSTYTFIEHMLKTFTKLFYHIYESRYVTLIHKFNTDTNINYKNVTIINIHLEPNMTFNDILKTSSYIPILKMFSKGYHDQSQNYSKKNL